jgi:uncharacterized protein YyaL (SSP411 family)
MSVWLTPDLKPFFGGTYFPPESRWGRPGFSDVLREVARAWRDERPKVLQGADTIVDRLRQATSGESAPDRAPVADRRAVDAGIAMFAQACDARHGGFGGAPKFPRPSELLFLLQGYALTGDAKAKAMALDTLRAMALGGIRDHIGGGFHRYSVDAEWRVPHFEKMLYDQAQLVVAYLEAAQASGDGFYAAVAEDTLDYVRRDLTADDGAFLSAEDADSLPPSTDGAPAAHAEKREGAFYVWTAADIDRLLGADAGVARRRFGIVDAGNALADPQGEFRGQNLLYVAQSIEDVAARASMTPDAVMAALGRMRQTLFDERSKRPRPHLDDKVIAAWNGLMIAACARAARVLVESPRRSDWLTMATRAAEAIRRHLWRPDSRRLLRRYRDGEAAVEGFCEDYAYVAWGAIELFQATADARWLEWALELTAIETELFSDDKDGGWFSTTGQDPRVILRLKEDYDGAEPAAASITVRNLLTLGQITGDAALVARAGRTLERYGPQIGQVVRVMPFMVANAAMWNAPRPQIVLAGAAAQDDRRALETELASHYLPFAVTLAIDPAARPEATSSKLPWLAAMDARDGRAAGYVCVDFVCRAPVTDRAAFGREIENASAPRRII